jgi:hypothetical protein
MNYPSSITNREWGGSGRIVKTLGVGLALLFLCVPAFAQLNLGRLYGAITDQTGGAVAGATVTIVDVERGVNRSLTSDTAGEYNAPSLTPGTYTVRAEAKGFQTIQRENVVVGVGQEVRVDLVMRPGEQTQTITVTEAIPMVNTTSSELGGNVESRDLEDLPINGRSFAKLLNYTPGAVSINGNDTFFNGVRYTQNEWMFDGIDDLTDANTGPMIGGTSGFTESTILPADAIQEVHLATNGKAEYGWKPGGAINIGIKSGTNRLHGTAIGMGRDSAFESKNAFAASKTSDQLTQQGATLGGPIKKDKLFFFVGYEGQSYTVASPGIDQLPASLASATGTATSNNVPDALYDIYANTSNFGAGKPQLPASQLSLNLLGCQATPAALQAAAKAAPNAAVGAAAIQNLCYPGGAINSIFNNPASSVNSAVAPSSVGGSQNGLGKIDYHLNDHNSLNFEYFFGEGPSLQATGAEVEEWWVISRYNRAQAFRGVWVWTPNSRWLNEARIGNTRQHKFQVPGDCFGNLGQPDYASQYGFTSGVNTPGALLGPSCAFPTLTVSGFAALGGNGGNGGQDDDLDDLSGVDSVSYTHGKHQFKFGGELHKELFSGSSKLANGSGTLTFGSINAFSGATSLEDFATGTVGSSTVLVGNPLITASWPRYALFVQDDWRLKSKLTVNLGLRYEIVPPFHEKNNQVGGFEATSPEGLVQTGNQIPALWATKYNQFAPRVGFAYDLTGKGTTVVRGGFGLAYNLNNFNDFLSITQGAAVNTVPTGWNLFLPNGALLPKAGNMTAGNLNAPSGSLVNWLPHTNVFNTNTSFLACGNGLGLATPLSATGAANPANPPPCSIQVANPNIKEGYVTSWNLSIQHAIGSNLALTVAYVGTHGTDLEGVQDINQPAPGFPNGKSAPSSDNEQLLRPYTQNCAPAVYSAAGALLSGVPGGLGLNLSQCFPYLGQIKLYTQGGTSNYNGLQASLEQRVTHGLFFTASYTLSHSLDDASNDYGTFYMNSNCIRCDYGRSTFDFRHTFSLRFTYNIPGRKAPAQMLEGWQVNSAIEVFSGQPIVGQDTSTDISGTGELLDRWSILGSPKNIRTGYGVPCYGITGSKFASSGCIPVNTPAGAAAGTQALVANMPPACITEAGSEATNPTVVAGGVAGSKDFNGLAALADYGCYYENGTAIVPPAQGTFGNMGRNILTNGVPYREWDASITKAWKIKELMTVQFRAEGFNVLNQVIHLNPGGKVSSPTAFGLSTALGSSGDPILGSGGPRQVVLSLKLIF